LVFSEFHGRISSSFELANPTMLGQD
jgi:hypothetical protein